MMNKTTNCTLNIKMKSTYHAEWPLSVRWEQWAQLNLKLQRASEHTPCWTGGAGGLSGWAGGLGGSLDWCLLPRRDNLRLSLPGPLSSPLPLQRKRYMWLQEQFMLFCGILHLQQSVTRISLQCNLILSLHVQRLSICCWACIQNSFTDFIL